MTQDQWSAFWDPGRGGDPEWLARFLGNAETDPRTVERYVQKYELLGLTAGQRVLDLGCGNGSDVMRMAPLVGPAGSVVGVDLNPAMTASTASRAAEAGLTNVTTVVSDGAQLDFPDGSFDAVHTERVLIYPEDPLLAIREMVRVVRPGGRVVCCELEIESRHADLDDMELHDRVYQHGGGFVRNARIGRQLPRHFKRAGLVDIEVRGFVSVLWGGNEGRESFGAILEGDIGHALTLGLITQAEAVRFRELHEDLLAANELFTAHLSFLVKGMKPLD